NIEILQGGTVAKTIQGYSRFIVFTDRPVNVNEKVGFRLLQKGWLGAGGFGFTNKDPASIRNLADLNPHGLGTTPGFWTSSFTDISQNITENGILEFYVSQVHLRLGLNNIRVVINGVDTRRPLWAVLDVYGHNITWTLDTYN
ncbi:unnamed protein product, partial [Allacma fusca]